jgi:hypothetical protein
MGRGRGLPGTARADDPLIMLRHLLQESGKSCSAIFAANLHILLLLVHPRSISPTVSDAVEPSFLVERNLGGGGRFIFSQPYAKRQNVHKMEGTLAAAGVSGAAAKAGSLLRVEPAGPPGLRGE